MASLADYAPRPRPSNSAAPSPWLAALLTVLTPGLGHIYIGLAEAGHCLFLLLIVLPTRSSCSP